MAAIEPHNVHHLPRDLSDFIPRKIDFDSRITYIVYITGNIGRKTEMGRFDNLSAACDAIMALARVMQPELTHDDIVNRLAINRYFVVAGNVFLLEIIE